MKSAIHCIKYFLGVDRPVSQTTLQERLGIVRYAKGKLRACEIGVFEGLNTAAISASLGDKGTLHAIDPFFVGRLGVCYGKMIAHSHVKRSGEYNKVTWIERLSGECFSEVPANLDFVFVDGDHSLEGISCDWEKFSPKLIGGGMILLHDSFWLPNNKSLDSHLFYSEVISKDDRFDFVERIDSMAVLRRKS